MTPQQLHPSDDLQHRIEELESKLARLQAQARNSRLRKFPVFLSYSLIPLLVVGSFGLAQPESPPAPGAPTGEDLRPDPDANDLIRNVGGITQVNAPFEVVDASGKIILSVGTTDKDAGVAIYVGEGAGGLSVNSGGAVTVVELGTDENGNGTLRALDAEGNVRAGISGEAVIGLYDESGETRIAALAANTHGAGSLSLLSKSGKPGVGAEAGTASDGGVIKAFNAKGQTVAGVGVDSTGKGLIAVVDTGGTGQLSIDDTGAPALVILDKSNKQLAVVDSVSGKGRVAVLQQGRTTAELTGAEAGGGSLVVHSSGGERIATVGVGDNGRGGVTIFQNGIDAAVLSTSDSGAGGLSLQNAQGEVGLSAVGGEGSFGGNVVAYNNSGEEVAGIGSSDEGKGRIVVLDKDMQVASLKADESGAGSMTLMTTEGKKGVEATGQGGGESSGGSVMVFNQAEEEAVTLRVEDQGGGVIGAYSDDGATAEMTADSLELLDDGEPILSLESDPGQLAVFDEGAEVVRVGLSDQGMGQVMLLKESKAVVSLEVTGDGEGEVDVYGKSSGKPSVAMRSNGGSGLVAVTNSSGEVVSEMSVLSGGHGQVVVWNPGGKVPAVVMTRSPDTPGGLVQVSNDQLGVSFLTVGPMGAGQLQLHDTSGNNMVEAGTAEDRGMVRVGPLFKCSPLQAASPVMAFGVPDCILGATK